jgi:transcription elongation factor/antiterminator RfaH
MAETGQRLWYVVYTKPAREAYASDHLKQKGLEVFFPRLEVPSRLFAPRGLVPLFPNYLFVRLRLPEGYYEVIWCPGVRRLVSFDATPAPLDDGVMEFLQARATAEGIVTGHSTLSVGAAVEVTTGPLAGLSGILQEPPDAKGRVQVLMRLLNRDLTIVVPLAHLESGWTVAPAAP